MAVARDRLFWDQQDAEAEIAELREQLARARALASLCRWAQSREARVGRLNARVWRLIAHHKRRQRRGRKVRRLREAAARLMRMNAELREGRAKNAWDAARREVAAHGKGGHGSAEAAARYLHHWFRAAERRFEANSRN